MNVKAKSACRAVVSLSLLTFLCPPSGAWAQPPAKPATAPTSQDSPFANVPKDSWIYPVLSTLEEHHTLRISLNGDEGRFRQKGDLLTRYEVAVLLARNLDIVLREEDEKKKNPDYRKTPISLVDIAQYERLTTEFNVELKTLGMDVTFVLRKLDGMEQEARAAEPPFLDVAPTHWASASVERLRVAGVVVGYPNGTFLLGRSDEKEEGKRK